MKKYIWKESPSGATQEERDKIYSENALGCFNHAVSNIPKIKRIFAEQTSKPGDSRRSEASDAITTYLVEEHIDEIKKKPFYSELYWTKADILIRLTNIIEAVNSNDREAIESAYQALPFGQSNTGDSLSFNAMQFAYWIMSDEAREKYGDIALKYLIQHNICAGDEQKAKKYLESFASLEKLDSLLERNENMRQEREEKKISE